MRRMTLVSVLVGGLLCLAVVVNAQIPAEERDALIALYNSTDGANWSDNTGWLGGEGTECIWFGVACSGGSVESLILSNNELVGTLPPELGDLGALQRIDLRRNQLSGTIPVELGRLSVLIELTLLDNQLTGTIPVEFGDLSALEELWLSDNGLIGTIPPELGSLPALGQLWLTNNELNGTVPADISGASELEVIALYDNRLSGTIPPELGELAQLRWLFLNRNALTGTIPPGIGRLTALESLSLHSNRLSGTIPAEVGNSSALFDLVLNNNELSGTIPPELGRLSGIINLHLDENQLTGSIPEGLGDLTALESLRLGKNRLSGPILSKLGNLSGLVELNLSNNQLTGSIPSELGGLSNLWMLRLQVNQLSGSIPQALGDLASLDFLDVSMNRLSGSIPPEIGSLTELTRLLLASNHLTGVVPIELSDLTNLSTLDLCGNALYSDDAAMNAFLDDLQPGWLACQDHPEAGIESEVTDPAAEVSTDLGSATDNRGNRVVVWKQSSGKARGLHGNLALSTQAAGVFGRYFDPSGDPVGEAIEIATGVDLDSPTVSFDAVGNFVIGWEAGGAGDGIFGRYFGSDQQPLTEAFQIDEEVGLVPTSPRVAVSSAGDFVMVWQSGTAKQAGDGIFGRYFNPDGTPAGSVVRVDSGDAEAVSDPDVGMNASGASLVVWQQELPGKQGVSGIFGRYFNPDGAPAGDAIQINEDPVVAVEPAVGSDALGNTVVAWSQQSVGGAGFDIVAHRFDVDGEPIGGQLHINTGTAGDQGRPAVGVNAQGDFAVAWESAGPGKQTADGVFGRFFNAGGFPVGPDFEVAVEEEALIPASPEVTVGSDATVTVAYTKVDAAGTGNGVFFKTVDVKSLPGGCVADGTTLCLNNDRFQVRVGWRDFAYNAGVGEAVALTDDTGYFWFFSDTNVELILKVLDGTAINGHYWVYYGALSNVEYTITVMDTITGSSVTYYNPSANFASAGDTTAIPGGGKSVHRLVDVPPSDTRPYDLYLYTELAHLEAPAMPRVFQGDCVPGDTNLCLNASRFEVDVSWEDFEGNTGDGQAVPLTGDTGYFWFFSDANVELVIKVLDGTMINGRYWVFYGALSNVGYTITVTDTETDEVRTYINPLGNFGSGGDTEAFEGP